MRYSIILLLLFFWEFSAYSQRHMFGKTGTMSRSSMHIDTVIHATSQREKRVYLFKIEPGYNDSLNLRKFIPGKFFAGDMNAYFILANFSGKPLTIRCINDQLLTEENCEFTNQIYKPIDFLIHPKCMTGVTDIMTLQPFDVLIFRDGNRSIEKNNGTIKKTYLRLKTSTGIVRSCFYNKRVNQTDFFLPLELKPDFEASYRQVVFKE